MKNKSGGTLAISVLLLSAVFMWGIKAYGAGIGSGEDKMYTETGRRTAADFPSYAQWINTDRNWRIEDFRGKVVLLDFWTYCCINCIHVLPDLKKLEQKYPELVVVGVHSAKFTGERDLENIREAVLRYDIEHPVINDYKFELWQHYGIRSWPSFVLIDPEGGFVGGASGEGLFDLFDQQIGAMVDEFGGRGLVDHERIEFELEKFDGPRSLLSFPGKLEVDTGRGRLFISDSNNDRILVTDPDGKILEVIGSGEPGNRDGDFSQASFFRPQGMAYDPKNDALYIADTENHTVRCALLTARTVETVLGTGSQGRGHSSQGRGVSQAINSPWDLVFHDGLLIIAMAGPHQLWSLETRTGVARVWAGNGRENLVDGPAAVAQLAQPSGLSVDGGALYFADSEVSAVRKVQGGRVSTLLGEGLFEFGDLDGPLGGAHLQHALGVLYHDGDVLVADTYNNKIKRIDLSVRRIETIAGTGQPGRANGPARESTFNEPNDIKYLRGRFYITDTNNGLIRVLDPASGGVTDLELSDLGKLSGHTGFPVAGAVELEPVTIAPGDRRVSLTVQLPPGRKASPGAPHSLEMSSSSPEVVTSGQANWLGGAGRLVATLPLNAVEGQTTLTLRIDVYFCEDGNAASCYIERKEFSLPVSVRAAGDEFIELTHVVGTPGPD
jgi:DNA-binding beta-propeller fold protein YncE